MNPRDLHTLAQRLANEQGAAECRTAINRAYYAAYNTAVEFLTEVGCSLPSTAESHSRVREALAHAQSPPLRNCQHRLGELYAWRERADYRMGDSWPENPLHAGVAVQTAERIIRDIGSIKTLSDADRLKVAATILNWNWSPRRSWRS